MLDTQKLGSTVFPPLRTLMHLFFFGSAAPEPVAKLPDQFAIGLIKTTLSVGVGSRPSI